MLQNIGNFSNTPPVSAEPAARPERQSDSQPQSPDAPNKPARDEYTPEKPRLSAGLYNKDGKKDDVEEVTGSTDKVDKEIQKLKEKKEKLEQEIARAKDDPEKLEKLQKQLEQVEQELRVKDTDSYRRQHMEVKRTQI